MSDLFEDLVDPLLSWLERRIGDLTFAVIDEALLDDLVHAAEQPSKAQKPPLRGFLRRRDLAPRVMLGAWDFTFLASFVEAEQSTLPAKHAPLVERLESALPEWRFWIFEPDVRAAVISAWSDLDTRYNELVEFRNHIEDSVASPPSSGAISELVDALRVYLGRLGDAQVLVVAADLSNRSEPPDPPTAEETSRWKRIQAERVDYPPNAEGLNAPEVGVLLAPEPGDLEGFVGTITGGRVGKAAPISCALGVAALALVFGSCDLDAEQAVPSWVAAAIVLPTFLAMALGRLAIRRADRQLSRDGIKRERRLGAWGFWCALAALILAFSMGDQ